MTTPAPHAYIRSGREIDLSRDSGDRANLIAGGYYLLKFNHMRGYYLTQQDDIGIPRKIYGDCSRRLNKVINTFKDRPNRNTGVLLVGNKGSGKTMLSTLVCNHAVNVLGYPVIKLEDDYQDTNFIEFLDSITQPCVVFIDEFEKKYSSTDSQNAILGLLDGNGIGNKLYLLTSNSNKISEYLLSRPGRIFYVWNYGKLDLDVFTAYCEDNLKDKRHMGNLLTLWKTSNDISFDIVQALVEELNRYPEDSFADTIIDMNVAFGDALSRRFHISNFEINGEKQVPSNPMVQINTIDFQSGEYGVYTRAYINNFALQMDIRKHVDSDELIFSNESLYIKHEKGVEITEEEMDDYFNSEVSFRLYYDPNTDSFDGDKIHIEREYGPVSISVDFEIREEITISNYMRILFKD